MFLRTACLLALLSLMMTCSHGPVPETDKTRVPPPPPLELPKFTPTNVRAIVDAIPTNASREQMDVGVNQFLTAFQHAQSGELTEFVDALSVIKDQPQLVPSLVGYYERLPRAKRDERMIALGVVGELQRVDALPFLNKTIWTKLPRPQRGSEGVSARGMEEMVQVKAVQGLGYLQSEDGDRALVDVMKRHESKAVKIAAIDSYMWNHHHTRNAAAFLYQNLANELHPYVEQPHFYRGMDPQQFNEEVKAWRSKWTQH